MVMRKQLPHDGWDRLEAQMQSPSATPLVSSVLRASQPCHLSPLCGCVQGVFVNPALVEPFGLTLIEVQSPVPLCRLSALPLSVLRFLLLLGLALSLLWSGPIPHNVSLLPRTAFLCSLQAAARGLPMVATKNGGPVDIQKVRGHDSHPILAAPYPGIS